MLLPLHLFHLLFGLGEKIISIFISFICAFPVCFYFPLISMGDRGSILLPNIVIFHPPDMGFLGTWVLLHGIEPAEFQEYWVNGATFLKGTSCTNHIAFKGKLLT